MRSTIKCLIASGVLSVLVGCAGTDFVRPDAEGLKNGQTTYAQAQAKMGAPWREGSVVKNDKTIKTAAYAYASVGGKPRNEGVTAARALTLYFHEDVLVGHEFISSWAEDHTDFNQSRIKDIVKGKTDRAQVIQLLGKPGGYYVYPMTKDTRGEAAVYAYLETRGFSHSSKLLLVSFDASGLVADVEFTSHGSK